VSASPDLPVLSAPAQPLAARTDRSVVWPALPAIRAATVAAGGFFLGAAFARLLHRRSARSVPRPRPARRRHALSLRRRRARREAARGASVLEIVGSRSLLVDVHLLAGRD
jgi:hypothetical protein